MNFDKYIASTLNHDNQGCRRGSMNLGATHENLDHKAYLIIKKMIIDRKLMPGDKISQEKLARQMGISRTPVVSALKYLENEKLVEAMPRRGFYVRLFTMQEMVSIFELREVLEGLAARRAASLISESQIKELSRFFNPFKKGATIVDVKGYAREDRRFHNFVTDVGAREFLKSILQTYNIISFSYQVVSSEGLVRSPEETIHEHLAIIEAICDKDASRAEELMRGHFKQSIARLKKEIAAVAIAGKNNHKDQFRRSLARPMPQKNVLASDRNKHV